MMKMKTVWALAALMCVGTAITATAYTRIYVEDFEIAAGETKEMVICMDNDINCAAFQADIYLPKGITFASRTLGGNKIYTLSMNEDRDWGLYTLSTLYHEDKNFFRIVAYTTTQGMYIEQATGEICYIKIEASEDYKGDNLLEMKNIRVADPAANETILSNEVTTVSGPAVDVFPLHISDSFYNLVTLYTYSGNSEKVKFTPTAGYTIASATFNGEDVMAELVDGTFTTPAIEGESLLSVTYDEQVQGASTYGTSVTAVAAAGDEVPINIIDSEKGTITLYSEWGDREKIGFSSKSDNFLLSGVLHGEEDVTSQLEESVYTTPMLLAETTIEVSYQIPTHVEEQMEDNRVNVYGRHGEIVVDGCQVGERINIYATDGVLLTTLQATAATQHIPLPTQGIYLVRVGNNTVKVVL